VRGGARVFTGQRCAPGEDDRETRVLTPCELCAFGRFIAFYLLSTRMRAATRAPLGHGVWAAPGGGTAAKKAVESSKSFARTGTSWGGGGPNCLSSAGKRGNVRDSCAWVWHARR
jgi:hypothetical protein